MDSKGDLALDLALRLRLDGIAQTLVQHKVDIDRSDHSGLCLLHKAIKRGRKLLQYNHQKLTLYDSC